MTIPINTNNFYKFITTVSLVSTIYFFSFHDLFLNPYIKEMTSLNIQVADLSAEYGYLKGKYLDLSHELKDSVKNGYISYFYFTKEDSIKNFKIDTVKYYSTIKIRKSLKNSVDTLNLVGNKFAKVSFKLDAINQTQKALEKNIKMREIIYITLGIVSFCIFCFGIYRWFTIKSYIDS